ncbi:hypothetical protein CPAR01_13781 [Colletotrichum paranaense]|uniref:Uncharacterized protein n=1 Tax=Colletotrichum paranaense TaxID=1914294 RepID=A0ABQ9S4Q9_9PEZI|nr:uncharacterized protein CPAR01_13781 [Colletotrichum paranaense]KAK1524833.1 hypothetical protein CPAR01_13781 [Colletotrichum paranaense]
MGHAWLRLDYGLLLKELCRPSQTLFVVAWDTGDGAMGPGARDGVGLNKPEVCQEGYLFSAVAQWLIAHPEDFADVDTMSSIAKRWNTTMAMTRDILVGKPPEPDSVVAVQTLGKTSHTSVLRSAQLGCGLPQRNPDPR